MPEVSIDVKSFANTPKRTFKLFLLYGEGSTVKRSRVHKVFLQIEIVCKDHDHHPKENYSHTIFKKYMIYASKGPLHVTLELGVTWQHRLDADDHDGRFVKATAFITVDHNGNGPFPRARVHSAEEWK